MPKYNRLLKANAQKVGAEWDEADQTFMKNLVRQAELFKGALDAHFVRPLPPPVPRRVGR